VEKITRDRKQANNLFIAQESKSTADNANAWVVLSAASGYQSIDKATQVPYVVADNGNRYEGTPGQSDYKIFQFTKYAMRLPDAPISSMRQLQEAVPTSQLLAKYDNPNNASELQWRISIPLSTFLLGLLAVPLSQVRPRQGRYAMLLPALLVYVVYMNLLFAGRNLIEQKLVPTYVGMWWVHLLPLALLLWVVSSWRTRST
jgi:lipopolysaccharide export system permease protein